MQKAMNTQLRGKIMQFCESTIVFSKLSKDQLEDYKALLEAKALRAILQDEDLMSTIEAFFKNNLNISATSKDAFMHRNTLIYRIEKIKREIGLNIKNFEDARILKNIIILNNIINKKNS